jgi:hypothetical protein
MELSIRHLYLVVLRCHWSLGIYRSMCVMQPNNPSDMDKAVDIVNRYWCGDG